MVNIPLGSAVDILAIILSTIALIVTIIGFFASLKFYRDGVALQTSANNAFTRIEEKSQTIQTQLSGMFDKTLDAAIGRKDELNEDFEALNVQLESTAAVIVEEAQKEIGNIGHSERQKLIEVVNQQIELIREKVEETRESAEEAAESPYQFLPQSQFQAKILSELAESGRPLTLDELSNRVNRNTSVTLKSVSRLQSKRLLFIDKIDNAPTIFLTKQGLAVTKST